MDILGQINKLPLEARKELLSILDRLDDAKSVEQARNKFLSFARKMWPPFISGRHHKIMAEAFDEVIAGTCRRLMIHMPPRHTKSEFGSWLLPAYYMGHKPSAKTIMSSHTADLAMKFGRKVRNLVDSKEYQEVFPGIELQADNKAAGRWNTNKGGEYYAVGVGGNIAGWGADLFVIDDPHSEQDGIAGRHDPTAYDRAFDWYTSGPRQRLQPGGAIVLIATRWSLRDLPGQILERMGEHGSSPEWRVIEFPAIFPDTGNALWPEFWPLKELLEIKADIEPWKWNAQYQQNPTADEGAIVKREWWRKWERSKRPKCEAIMMSWDTAHLKTQRSDYSACTVWGAFKSVDSKGRDAHHLILLHAYRDRLEFPELKSTVKKMYREWDPDMLIVEAKAAGASLIQELRSTGIPVQEFTPTRGNDKIARMNAVADLFSSGAIWYMPTEEVSEVIEECAAFPAGAHDDYVDTVSQALLRFRQGGFVRLESDIEDEEDDDRPDDVEYY